MRYLAAVMALLLPVSAGAQVLYGPAAIKGGTIEGVSVTPDGGVQSPLGTQLARQGVPTNTNVCFVGDSITAATLNQNTQAITATGGTGPYTFAVTGLPSGAGATTSSPNLYFTQASAALGTYAITVTATDSGAVTGAQPYTLTIATSGLTITTNGAGTGTLAVGNPTIVKLQDSNRGPAQQVSYLTNRRVATSQALNFGHSGDTTAAVLARMAAPLAANCGSYVVMIGTNDLGGVSTATIQANLTSIWTQLLATGRPVIAQTILPRTLSAGATMDQLWLLNRWIRQQNGTLPGLFIVDGAAAYGDPISATATPRVGATVDYTYSYDGLHPKGIGAQAAFTPLANLFNAIYPDRGYDVASIADLYSTTNTSGSLIANPMMTFAGATGTVGGRNSGTAPDGWQATTADGGCSPCTFTTASSASTLADGTPSAQFVVSGTAGGGFQTLVMLTQNITNFANFSIGDKIQGSCRVEVAAGSAHLTAPFIQITYSSTGVAYTLAAGPSGVVVPTVSDAGPATAYSGTISTPLPAPALKNVPSGTLSFWVGVYITNTGSQTVAGTFKVGACSLRKV